jgi:hypothetical protein
MDTSIHRPAVVDETVVFDQQLHTTKRISWGSIIAGAIIAIMIQALLNILFLGLGFNAVDPATDANPLAGIGTGTIFGFIFVTAVSLFVGGLVASRLATATRKFDALLHGIMVWAVTTMLSVFLVSSAAGSVFNNIAGLVGQGLSAAGQGISAIAPEAAQAVQNQLEQNGVTLETVRQEAQQFIQEADVIEGGTQEVGNQVQNATANAQDTAGDVALNPQQTGREIDQLLSQLSARGGNIAESAERQDLIDGLVGSTNISEAQAEETVDGWLATLQQGQDQLASAQEAVVEATERATDTLGTLAIWAFVSLLIGAAIAAIGGYAGGSDKLEVHEAHV